MRQRVLITGATGFIGRHLAQRLQQAGCWVRVLVRNKVDLAAPLQAVDVIQGDLTDAQAMMQAVQGMDVIYHCAANVATWGRWSDYQTANIDGLQVLLTAISEHNPQLQRLLHFSTVDVYGYPSLPCAENATLSATPFAYGESKRQAEQLLQRYGQTHGVAYTIVRPGNVIGPGSQFIERIGQALDHGLMLRIDQGQANAGLVYIDNLVEYVICLANSADALGQVFNLRDPYDVNWAQFVNDLRQGIAGKGRVVDLPYWLAAAVAQILQALYRGVRIGGEPLLHPLIVNMFGKTCGHSAAKLHSLCHIDQLVGYEEAMQRSVAWFEATNHSGPA